MDSNTNLVGIIERSIRSVRNLRQRTGRGARQTVPRCTALFVRDVDEASRPSIFFKKKLLLCMGCFWTVIRNGSVCLMRHNNFVIISSLIASVKIKYKDAFNNNSWVSIDSLWFFRFFGWIISWNIRGSTEFADCLLLIHRVLVRVTSQSLFSKNNEW